MKIVRLRITDFDLAERETKEAEYISTEKYFLTDVAFTNYMRKHDPDTYQGWNGETYPKYEVTQVEVIE